MIMIKTLKNLLFFLGNFGFRQYTTEGTDLTAPANGKING